MHELTKLIREDMKPALGVTEPGAIAFAAAKARSCVPGEVKSIKVSMNSGMYKNAFTCGIPGTDQVGSAYAAALGTVAGDPEKGLECLACVTEEDNVKARELIRAGRVSVDGVTARAPEDKADPAAVFTVDGERISGEKQVYLMLHKPAGLVSATEDPRQPTVLELLPELYWPGTVLSILYMFAYGGVLYVLRGESGRYRTAGTLLLISGVISVVMLLAFSANAFAVIVSLAASVIVFVAEYQEYMGHAEVLAGADSYLADRWRGLWRWMIYAFAASIGGALAALLFVQAAFLALLFLLVSVAGMIALLVLGILKLVYLWRTARVFRELAG